MLRPYGTASMANSVSPVPELAVQAPGIRRWKELSELLSELQEEGRGYGEENLCTGWRIWRE